MTAPRSPSRAPLEATPESPAASRPVLHLLPPIDERSLPGASIARRAARLMLAVGAGSIVIALVVARSMTIQLTTRATGTLEPLRVVSARARDAGIVTRVLAAPGQSVSNGDLLAVLDTAPTRQELADLRARRAKLREDVRRTTALAPLALAERDAALAQAASRVLRARATLRERLIEYGASGDLDSLRRTYKEGTSVAIDLALADLLSAEADVRTATTARDRAVVEQRLDASQQTEDESAVLEREEIVRDRRGDLLVVAPAAGSVLTEEPRRWEGAYVRPGDELFEIADLDGWRAIVWLADREVRDIKAGQRVSIDIPALHGIDWRPLEGRVESIAADVGGHDQASGRPGSYRTVIAISPDALKRVGMERLRRGYAIEARIVTREGKALTLAVDRLLRADAGQ